MHGPERQYRLHGRPGPLDHLLRRPPTRTESNFGPPFWLILGPKIREIRKNPRNFRKFRKSKNFQKKSGRKFFKKFRSRKIVKIGFFLNTKLYKFWIQRKAKELRDANKKQTRVKRAERRGKIDIFGSERKIIAPRD